MVFIEGHDKKTIENGVFWAYFRENLIIVEK
jgi:hypothetical protein